MRKISLMIAAYMLVFACAGLFVSAEVVCDEYWQDSLEYVANGEYACDVPYGYLWEVEDVDGVITGEDATICTTTEAYNNCNAKWAVTIVLEEQEDGTYVAIRRAIVGEGTQYNLKLEENQVAFVVHSGGSVPQNCLGSYENWLGKVTACSIRKGDVFEIDLTPGNMAVAAIGKLVETSSEESSDEAVSSEAELTSEEVSQETSAVAESSEENAVEPDTDDTVIAIVCIALIVASAGVIVAVTVKRKK